MNKNLELYFPITRLAGYKTKTIKKKKKMSKKAHKRCKNQGDTLSTPLIIGATGWLSWKSIGLEIQIPEVRALSVAQDKW